MNKLFKGAPNWVKWRAIDQNGNLYYYESRPFIVAFVPNSFTHKEGRSMFVKKLKPRIDWRGSAIFRTRYIK